MAGQHLKKIEHVCILETYAQEFANKVGDHARYGELVKENYGSIREEVNAICDEIRKETNTQAVLRPSTPDFESDDSWAGRGEKSTTPQVLMGDEVESVLEPEVLFEVQLHSKRMMYVCRLLNQLEIGNQLLTRWGFILK